MRLSGKTALVTGSGSGIGKAIAIRFSKEGADVAVNYLHNEEGAKDTCRAIEDTGRKCIAVKADVSSSNQVREMVGTVADAFGKIDILVNNSGVVINEPFLELSEDTWNTTMDINLKGAFLCSQAYANTIVKNKQKGKIINISSISSVVTYHYSPHTHYEVSKAGMNMLTKRMALELAPYGINVNAIAPGVVQTRVLRPGKNRDSILEHIPLGRFAQPEDITGTAVFLSSEDSDYVTGAIIFVDGGWMIY